MPRLEGNEDAHDAHAYELKGEQGPTAKANKTQTGIVMCIAVELRTDLAAHDSFGLSVAAAIDGAWSGRSCQE